MKVILNVKNTGYKVVAQIYGGITIDKVKFVYLHQHDALIRKDLYLTYKNSKNFEDFLLLVIDK
jgi:hypothetical protein